MLDNELMTMRNRMSRAAELDNKARENGEIAMNKLLMIDEVVGLLNRNNLRYQIVDPDINILESVRFFLEPLSDGSLPSIKIQKELFKTLLKLPMTKDTLVASGIGKVILFYNRSKKVEPEIKNQAEKLARDWMRLILKREGDYRKKAVQSAQVERYVRCIISFEIANSGRVARMPEMSARERADNAKEKMLALPVLTNRATVQGGLGTYTTAPKVNINASEIQRQPGQTGEEAFRRLRMKHQMKGKARR
jgi:transcription factor SPN1